MRRLAAEGRTVLVSSHLLSEVAQTVDDVVIIANGRLVAQGPLAHVTGRAANRFGVLVRTPQATEARGVLTAAELDVSIDPDGALIVSGATPDAVGRAVAQAGLTLYEMRPIDRTLEDVFLELTGSRDRDRSWARCCGPSCARRRRSARGPSWWPSSSSTPCSPSCLPSRPPRPRRWTKQRSWRSSGEEQAFSP